MSCCEEKMQGCGSRLCIACRPALKRYTLHRYPLDETGAPRLGELPESYTVCGFTAAVPRAGVKDKLEMPGRTASGQGGLRMTVIGCSCGEAAKGDRITVEGEVYRVAVVQRGTPAVAVLVQT